jgi:hypothetical protein
VSSYSASVRGELLEEFNNLRDEKVSKLPETLNLKPYGGRENVCDPRLAHVGVEVRLCFTLNPGCT